MAVMALLALYLAEVRGSLSQDEVSRYLGDLHRVPAAIDQVKELLAAQGQDDPVMKVLADAMKRLKSSRDGAVLTYELTLTGKDIDALVKAALKADD